ncbi:unnamed protein product [Timema podura]|uniref:Uncharacterized protein n=1 Tax=Timema podura TaxID=61482 RepID=A0ABN7NN27_TIMPD|nr:unnamed protein product [Timema podura]
MPLSPCRLPGMTKMEEVKERLKFFHDLVKDIVNNACHEALLLKGFTTDDSNIHTMPSLRKTRDGKMRMSYTEQANKRRYCIRLTSFIHLVDFIMLNMLHILMRNSLIEFTSVLESHFRCLPGDSTLTTIEINITLEEPRPDNAPQLPLFLVDVLIRGDALCLDPCQEVFMNAIVQLMDLWEETVMNVTTFLPDPFFNPFCECVSLTPLINERVEERLCGLGPDILSVLKEDITLIDLQAKVGHLLTANFAFATKYIERFEFIRDFYNENEARIHDDIKNELGSDAAIFIIFDQSTKPCLSMIQTLMWEPPLLRPTTFYLQGQKGLTPPYITTSATDYPRPKPGMHYRLLCMLRLGAFTFSFPHIDNLTGVQPLSSLIMPNELCPGASTMEAPKQ